MSEWGMKMSEAYDSLTMPTAATKSRPIVVLASQVKSTFERAAVGVVLLVQRQMILTHLAL